jgi:branched-chain amino acid transport system ATP-binding protein
MSDYPVLEMSGVSKFFRGLHALSNISLNLRQGEILGLIGPNGAGKTTLFNVVSGFLRPERGLVKFMGVEITGLQPHKICKMGMARTFQIVKPFGGLSILQNVALGCFNWTNDLHSAEKTAWEILEFVGLQRKALEPASSTTTPDRKRLELARALATRAKLLLLDETMAGLNPSEQGEISGLVRKVRENGATIFLIEHHMRVIMGLSDRIAVLDHGVCIAEGPPHSVCENRNVIEAYLGRGTNVAGD